MELAFVGAKGRPRDWSNGTLYSKNRTGLVSARTGVQSRPAYNAREGPAGVEPLGSNPTAGATAPLSGRARVILLQWWLYMQLNAIMCSGRTLAHRGNNKNNNCGCSGLGHWIEAAWRCHLVHGKAAGLAASG